MTALRTLAFPALILAAAGCGPSRPQAELDRGQAAVTAALENWKNADRPEKLKTLADPVEFLEDLRTSHTLTDYAILKMDGSDPAVIRYTVALKLKDRKGKPFEWEAVYVVALKSPVTVARDPYH
jgi:hypothetical protein